jgi:hypothetical protein
MTTELKFTLKKLLRTNKVIAGLTLLFALLAYGAVYRLLFKGFVLTNWKLADPSAIANYGTAFNGIVGTGITILGVAFLLYAYKDQKRQAEAELFNKLYTDLLDDINSIQYRKKLKRTLFSADSSELFQGVDALYNYTADDNDNPNSVMNHLNLIITSFNHLIKTIECSVYQSPDFQEIMRDKVYLLFHSKIYWPTIDGLYANYRYQLMNNNWGNAKIFFFEYKKFANQAFNYLIERNMLTLEPASDSLSDILKHTYTTWQEHWEAYPAAAPASTRVDEFVVGILGKTTLSTLVIEQLRGWPFSRLREAYRQI